MRYHPHIYFEADPLGPPRKGFCRLHPEMQIAMVEFARRFIHPNQVVADICCSNGYASQLLPAKQYIGVDHPLMIELINKKGRYYEGRIKYVPFDFDNQTDLKIGDCVDAILSLETVEHLQDPERFLYNLQSNLKSGGILLLSTPNNPNHHPPRTCDHIREFSLEEICELLTRGGFKIRDSYAIGILVNPILDYLEEHNIRMRRYNSKEKRSKVSRAVDHLQWLRKMSCIPVPYKALFDIGKTDTNMLIVSVKL